MVKRSLDGERGSSVTPRPATALETQSDIGALDIAVASTGADHDRQRGHTTPTVLESSPKRLHLAMPRSMKPATIMAPPLGYCALTSWEEIIKSIDYVRWDFGVKMLWICTLSTSSMIEVSTAQLAKMCPEKFARFLDQACSQGCKGNCGTKMQFATVPWRDEDRNEQK